MWNYSSFKKREKLKKKRLMTFVFWLKAIKAIIYLARLYTCTWPCYDKEQRKGNRKQCIPYSLMD